MEELRSQQHGISASDLCEETKLVSLEGPNVSEDNADDAPSTPKPAENEEEAEHDLLREPSSVALCRKVIATLDDEEGVCCSICLDEFTDEDPSTLTTCGHGYHLQCIMQWAQRSRECPLCFHTLKLEDETMNALLPFGEYVNPQQQAATAAMLENWELERFLVQLAVAEQRERRAGRSSRRRSHPQGERTAPRPIFGNRGTSTDPREHAMAAGSAPNHEASSSSPGEYPSSWPPSRGNEAGSSQGVEGLGQAIKSRWASLRWRESLNKTTKELKNLFGSASSSRQQQ